MTTLKACEQAITEELVSLLVHKYVHVPINTHTNPETEETVNAWFAGQVAGYEKAVLHYDFLERRYRDEPLTYYNILLNDGMGYVLSNEQCEIKEITQEQFTDMLAEHLAEQSLKQEDQEEEEEIIASDVQLPGSHG